MCYASAAHPLPALLAVRFDQCIERLQIGLDGDPADHVNDISDQCRGLAMVLNGAESRIFN